MAKSQDKPKKEAKKPKKDKAAPAATSAFSKGVAGSDAGSKKKG